MGDQPELQHPDAGVQQVHVAAGGQVQVDVTGNESYHTKYKFSADMEDIILIIILRGY